jgi:hypothetical protein
VTAPKHVALVAQRPSDFVEMRRAAEALHARGHQATFVYHMLFGADRHNELVLAQLRELERAGVCRPSEVVGATSGQSSLKAAMARQRFSVRAWVQARPRLRNLLRAAAVHIVVGAVNSVRQAISRAIALAYVALYYRSRLKYYRRWLASVRPDIILLPEDVVGYVSALMIKAGHELGIPSLILPYTVANQQEAFQSLKNNPAYQLAGPVNRVVGRLFPRWVMRRDGLAVLRLPAPYVLGHVMTQTSPPDPWMMNSGFANRIAVENDVMRDYYARAGIPLSKMEVVGALSDDNLARFRNDKEAELVRLKQELGLPGDLPLLLIGGCPDQRAAAPGFDFPGYEQLVAHMLESMAPLRRHYTFLMRPHPNFTELRPLFEARGVPVTTSDTARLVALADVYIAFASATLRWSIACGIPSVNYDAFHYDYDDFKGVPGVLNVSRPEEFRAAMPSLVPGTSDFRALQAAARAGMARWGRLDGRSVERIEALIGRLCAERPTPRTAA